MLKLNDFFIIPFCFFILYIIFSAIVKKDRGTGDRPLFLRAFYFKMLCSIVFTFIMTFYYEGGDSEMYFFATRDISDALSSNHLSLWEYVTATHVTDNSPLAPYFYRDYEVYPVYGFMLAESNFFVPKLAVIPYMIFFKSYLAICMVFSFFALCGAIRLYKMFKYYFPMLRREIAFAILFLPSVCFWSSGLLKDSLCFGAIGFFLYGIFNVFIRKQNIIGSLFWIIIGAGLLYFIKVYILLALLPAITLWLFGEMNKVIKEPTLRSVATFFTIAGAVVLVFVLLNYVTETAKLTSYQFENVLETSNYNRQLYEIASSESQGSYFQIQTSNPALLALNGFVATLFRPFLWEISSPIVFLSALEALIFILLTFYFLIKKGIIRFFKNAFGSPILLLCSSFAFVFAASVGSTTTNFGSLSRYKIPCLPFYLIMLFVIYYKAGLKLPRWTNSILNFIFGKQQAV